MVETPCGRLERERILFDAIGIHREFSSNGVALRPPAPRNRRDRRREQAENACLQIQRARAVLEDEVESDRRATSSRSDAPTSR